MNEELTRLIHEYLQLTRLPSRTVFTVEEVQNMLLDIQNVATAYHIPDTPEVLFNDRSF